MQNWTDNQQTVDTLFQVQQGQTVDSAAQGLPRHGLESVQNWTDNQQTVDTLFQVKQGQTVHTADQATMAKLDRK